MDLLSKWKHRQPLSDAVDLEMLGPELLASRHHGLSIDHSDGGGGRKSSKTPVRAVAAEIKTHALLITRPTMICSC